MERWTTVCDGCNSQRKRTQTPSSQKPVREKGPYTIPIPMLTKSSRWGSFACIRSVSRLTTCFAYAEVYGLGPPRAYDLLRATVDLEEQTDSRFHNLSGDYIGGTLSFDHTTSHQTVALSVSLVPEHEEGRRLSNKWGLPSKHPLYEREAPTKVGAIHTPSLVLIL
jgi:hypothetical protein